MNAQKKSRMIAISTALIAAVMFFTSPTNASVSSDRESVDFGKVEMGSSSTTTVNISNPDNRALTLTAFVFQMGSCGFSVRPQLPIELPGGGTVSVEIEYAPSALGSCYDILHVSTSNRAITGEVVLIGTGVEAPGKSLTVEELLEFFDTSVYYENLEDSKPVKSAKKRLNTLRSKIEAAGDLIENGNIDEACRQLLAVYKNIDSLNMLGSPPGFFQGETAEELSDMIWGLMERLECK
ncbi:MAG: hypothetical protein BBJ57_00615 [Desulfobacterales bacterium PC51MH44]|nr:MAG: hypothetical protein BBJ57_00615 [Desulfobacterales bacterium PC51MH44]